MSQGNDLNLYDEELRLEDGYLVRRWIVKDGFKREAKAPLTIYTSTSINLTPTG